MENHVKKFLIIIAMFFALPVFADTMPFYMDSIPKGTLGLYQTDKEITLYSHPDSNSNIVKKLEFSYQPESMPDSTFANKRNESDIGTATSPSTLIGAQIGHGSHKPFSTPDTIRLTTTPMIRLMMALWPKSKGKPLISPSIS